MGSSNARYAIREVAEMTGVKPVTLRAWQRRYQLVQPERTEKGHRLYTPKDVETIKRVQSWLAKGVSIGKVKALLASNSLPVEHDSSQRLDEAESLLQALSLLDGDEVGRILCFVLKEYPLDIVETQFVMPVLTAIDFVKMGQRSLQYALFRTLLIHQLLLMIQAESKKGGKHKYLLVNLDTVGNLFAWLCYARLIEKGGRVIFLDGVDDIGALFNEEVITTYHGVHLFAEKSLSEKHLSVIREQRANHLVPVYVSPVIEHLI
ncbi:MerR family transcriptional regulator [Vibrio methylphosphonaticus]|uniref:MerR family transcriptional regulator n=1 Tax=Vibrio methylphosphonaticus TaxID=2946866 RepID=UPI00202A8A23|nr:MerR family transcriptional regulator [Vibrio methylphosphonaticus]MCL9775742.1 MerR family transcriptional regulator [Vibrio methylphosphonaticus]